MRGGTVMSYDLQKASVWKRITAFLFDFILLGIVVVGFATLLSAVLGYDNHHAVLNTRYAEIENAYGVSFDINQEDYDAFSESERENYEKAIKALYSDAEFNYAYNMIFNLSFIIIIFSVLIGYLILEFAVPMFFKNGQTLGKKIFGIAVMRIDGVRISGPLLFTRTILGKYVVETMIPILFVIMILFGITNMLAGLIVIATVILTNIVMTIVSKTNSPIHDMLANTVTVDFASQLIFDSPEALLEYKQKIHAEASERADY